jgi:hypothetical protein
MMNPSTAVAVEGITTALTPQHVRLLFDVFTCIPEQLADIARSCGAIGTRPFCQMFHSYQKPTADDQECTAKFAQRFGVDHHHMTHPSYAIVLGPSSKLEYQRGTTCASVVGGK